MTTAPSLRVLAANALRWSIGARLATQVIRWGATLVVIRLLSPDDYGLLAMAMVVISFAIIFNELGASAVIVRTPDLTRNEIGSLQGLVAVLNLTLAAVVFLTAPFVSALYGTDITMLLRVCCLTFLAYSIAIVQEALLIRAMDFKSRALVETTSQLTGAMVTLALAVLGHGVWALVVGMIVGSTVKALGFLRLVPDRYPWRLMPSDLRQHALFAGSITSQKFIWSMSGQLDKLIIGVLHGPTLLGLYNVGKELALLPSAKLGSVLNELGFAVYARRQEQPAALTSILKKAIDGLALVLFPYAFLIFALASEGVHVVLGERWLPVTPIIQIVVLALPFAIINVQIYEALNACGHAGPVLRTQTVNSLVLVTLVGLGALIGIEAAAAGWAAGMVLAHSAYLRLARNLLGLPIRQAVRCYLVPLLVGLLTALFITGIRVHLSETLPHVTVFLLLTSAGGVLSVLLMTAVALERCRDLLAFARAR